jgi:hypothetical protein
MQQALTSPRGAIPSPIPAGGYRVDVGRGQRIGRVSSEWFSRPADERFLSLNDLHRAMRARADRSHARKPGGARRGGAGQPRAPRTRYAR